ncbi:hypothetical protein U9M48_010484 [Paspalum notatum var. saurae]|uniref:Uncharacterized protein n=1 Tax=Paspalum notatum var. saurae TaxID=547442 RepID=A0AAQ3SUV7_PASNO
MSPANQAPSPSIPPPIIMGLLRRLRAESDDEAEDIAATCCVLQYLKTRRLAVARHVTPATREYQWRDVEEGHDRLYAGYFAPNPAYGPKFFRRRYRMRKSLYQKIENACVEYKPDYFLRAKDCTGKWGASTIQKLTAAIRMLTTGKSADSFDVELRMGETTILTALREFTRAIVKIFGPQYRCKPNAKDLARLLEIAEARGFPGMLGSIDFMHWVWEKCPTGWHGQYRGHAHEPTMILEAVAGPDRWIWHCNFGALGSMNDINVLHRSSLFDDILTGNAPTVEYTVNGNTYNMDYYLGDGIYPNWATIVKGIPIPIDEKQKLFTDKQSAYRKDVECAFGILQKSLILSKVLLEHEDMRYIMETCIILHNMTIEDEKNQEQALEDDYEDSDLPQPVARHHPSIETIIDTIYFSCKRSKIIPLPLNLVSGPATLCDAKTSPHQSIAVTVTTRARRCFPVVQDATRWPGNDPVKSGTELTSPNLQDLSAPASFLSSVFLLFAFASLPTMVACLRRMLGSRSAGRAFDGARRRKEGWSRHPAVRRRWSGQGAPERDTASGGRRSREQQVARQRPNLARQWPQRGELEAGGSGISQREELEAGGGARPRVPASVATAAPSAGQRWRRLVWWRRQRAEEGTGCPSW